MRALPAGSTSPREGHKPHPLLLLPISSLTSADPEDLWAAQPEQLLPCRSHKVRTKERSSSARRSSAGRGNTGSETLHDLRSGPRCLQEARKSVKPLPVLPVSLSTGFFPYRSNAYATGGGGILLVSTPTFSRSSLFPTALRFRWHDEQTTTWRPCSFGLAPIQITGQHRGRQRANSS